MRIFLDTNIFLDVLSQRTGWPGSLQILDLIEKGKLKGFYSVMTIPIIWYLQKPAAGSRQKISEIVKRCQAVSLTSEMIEQVLKDKIFGDIEDELQYLSAKKANCQYLITRNLTDFKKAEGLKVLPPEELLSIIKE